MWQKERLERIMFDWSVKPKMHLNYTNVPPCLHFDQLAHEIQLPSLQAEGRRAFACLCFASHGSVCSWGFCKCTSPKRSELAFLRTGFGSWSHPQACVALLFLNKTASLAEILQRFMHVLNSVLWDQSHWFQWDHKQCVNVSHCNACFWKSA